MLKIDLTGQRVPKPVHPTALIFDNMRGGPYKYGYPVIYNAAAIKAMKEGKL